MRRKLAIALAIGTIGAVVLAATSSGTNRPAQGPHVTTIVALAKPPANAALPEVVQVDVDGNGSTTDTGDQWIFNHDVYDRTGKKKLGDTRSVCTITDPTAFGMLCWASTRLPDGEIHGMAYVDATTTTVVGSEVGGTGRYHNVRGWHEIPADGNTVTWYLLGVR